MNCSPATRPLVTPPAGPTAGPEASRARRERSYPASPRGTRGPALGPEAQRTAGARPVRRGGDPAPGNPAPGPDPGAGAQGWGRDGAREACTGATGLRGCLRRGKSLPGPADRAEARAGERAGRRHDGLAGPGGVTRTARAQGRVPSPLSPPPRGPRPQLPRYSRFVHQLPHLPHVQHRAPRGPGRASLSCSARTPEHFRAGADPGRVPPPPAAPNSPRRLLLWHSRGAAGDTSRRGARALRGAEVPEVPPRARGTPGLVVLSAPRGASD